MAYKKKTWISGEIITKEGLNNMENGIEAVEQSIPKLVSQLTNDAGYITEHLDLSNYAKKDELHEHNNKDILDGIDLVRIQAWDNAASNGGNEEESIDLSNYATKQDLSLKADRSELFSKDYNDLLNKPTIPDLNGYATQSYVDNEIEKKANALQNQINSLQNQINSLQNQINSLLERIISLEDQSVNDPEVPTEIPCTGISLNKYLISFTELEVTDTVSVTTTPADTTDTVSWKSSDNNVATITQFGLVTSRNYGTCTLTATCGNQTAECFVIVDIDTGTAIWLNKPNITFTEKGQTEQLSATIINPGDEPISAVSWQSTIPTVATVNQNGLVTAVGEGSCEIKASYCDLTDTCFVIVDTNINKCTSIYLNYTSFTLEVGRQLSLTPTFTPPTMTSDIYWTSSDTSVATVNRYGEVTAISPGTTTITVLCDDQSDTCFITVR